MITQIYRQFAGLPFQLKDLELCGDEQLCTADVVASVPALLRSGQLSSVTKAWGERLFYIPAATIPSVWDQIVGEKLAWLDPNIVTLKRGAKAGLANDIFRTLTFIAKDGLKLTAKRIIHARTLGKITELLQLKEEDVSGLRLRYPHEEVYPVSIAIVADLIISLGLVDQGKMSWSLNKDRLSAWLNLSLSEMNRLLFQHMLDKYVPDETVIQQFVYRLILPDLREGHWYSLSALWKELEAVGTRIITKEQEHWMKSWLFALSGFGWLDVGIMSSDEQLAFRWSNMPKLTQSKPVASSDVDEIVDLAASRAQSNGLIHVQPDFELLVPPDVSYAVRWELEICCDHVMTDVMSVYRLTKASVAGAAEQGRMPNNIMEWLHQHCSGVPDHVRMALEQWGQEFGRVVIEETLLLKCNDEQAAEKIVNQEALSGMVERIGPLHFIVNRGHEQLVRRLLDGMRLSALGSKPSHSDDNIYPMISMSVVEDDPLQLLQTSDCSGWISNKINLQIYSQDLSVPDYDELFPGLHEIPMMWVQEMRNYHSSTVRQMAEQAIRWRTKMRLSNADGIVECIPESIEDGDPWRVSGTISGKKVEWSPNEWGKIALVLPWMNTSEQL